jgi:hypothetical protein
MVTYVIQLKCSNNNMNWSTGLLLFNLFVIYLPKLLLLQNEDPYDDLEVR